MISQSQDPSGCVHERFLLLAAQRDDRGAEAELVRRYEPLIQGICSRHRRPAGCDRQDLVQEARIGLWHAIHAWRPGDAPFAAFARVCITRQVIKAIDSAAARKHQLLSHAVPISHGTPDDELALRAGRLMTPAAGPSYDPAAIVIGREHLEQIIDALPKLNDRERTVLAGSLNDRSWYQLASDHACTTQAIKGLLRRARTKLATAAVSPTVTV